jgi:ABC-type nitrate/sulfonate/bicarbonate transport system permease component
VPVAWGAVILLSLIGVALFQLIVVIERVFFPWSSSVEAASI